MILIEIEEKLLVSPMQIYSRNRKNINGKIKKIKYNKKLLPLNSVN